MIGLLLYLIELLKTEEIVAFSRDLFLWICSGFLIFHISYPVIAFSRVYLFQDSYEISEPLLILQFIIISISYSVIAFGFYWGNKRV